MIENAKKSKSKSLGNAMLKEIENNILKGHEEIIHEENDRRNFEKEEKIRLEQVIFYHYLIFHFLLFVRKSNKPDY